jgi:hypothetical protein
MKTTTLKTNLATWTDSDNASYYLALCLGIIAPDTEYLKLRHIFWTDNDLGNQLYHMLTDLVAVGVLERDADEDRFRWNPSFKGY